MRTCDLLIFDLDGTLIDSRADIADSLNLALQDFGLPTHSTEAITRMVGAGVAALVRRALDPAHHGFVERVLDRYRAHYRERMVAKTRLYDEIEDVLRRARACGLTLAVATNKPQDFARAILQHLGVLDLFAVVSGERAGQPRKPDPACLLEILAATHTPAAGALYVGDHHIDLQTARAAGVPVALVSWGFTPRPLLEAAHPDHLLDTPAELDRLITPVG